MTSSSFTNCIQTINSSIDTALNSKQTVKQSKSSKSKCGCLLCGARVVNFLRHLREYHRFSSNLVKKEAKRYKVTGPAVDKLSSTSFVKKYVCPIEGCETTVNRIDRHLIGSKHNLSTKDDLYRKYKKLAKLKLLPTNKKSDDDDDDDKDDDYYDNQLLDSRNVQNPLDDSEQDDDDGSNEFLSQSELDDESNDESFLNSEDPPEIDGNIIKDLNSYCENLTKFAEVGLVKSQSKIRQARQHVVSILKHFGNQFDIETVCDNLMKVESDFMITKLKVLQASTVKNYLLDFKRFISWAKIWGKKWITWPVADRIESLITLWNKKLSVLISKRTTETKLEHRKTALSEEDFAAYFNGEKAMKAHSIFSTTAKESKPVERLYISSKDHTCARDFLLMLLTVSNASRAGPIVNMNIKDVKDANYDETTGSYVISVVNHKTQRSHGAVQLSLDKEGFGYLATYICKIRPSIEGSDHIDEVFITSNAKSINQSELANILTKEMEVVLGQEGRRVSCTLIRKSIVSIVLQGNVGTKNETDLASLMKHSQWMQKNIYDLRLADSNMARMSGLVFKICTGKPLTGKDLTRPGTSNMVDDDDDDLVVKRLTVKNLTPGTSDMIDDNNNQPDEEIVNTGAGISGKIQQDVKLMQTVQIQIQDLNDIPNVSKQLDPFNVSMQSKHSRSNWPSELRNKIRGLFKECIRTKYVATANVKAVLYGDPKLLREVKQYTQKNNLGHNVKRVLDLVRSIIRYTK